MADDDKAADLGPDLAQGIASGDLSEGTMLAGHVGDEAVLVVRRGGKVSALAAQCTHYHGPLAEGLVVGDTIRCPWHHACFSIATGEALAAPALSPLDCYAVTESDGRIVVGTKKEQPKPKTIGGTGRIVIVGVTHERVRQRRVRVLTRPRAAIRSVVVALRRLARVCFASSLHPRAPFEITRACAVISPPRRPRFHPRLLRLASVVSSRRRLPVRRSSLL